MEEWHRTIQRIIDAIDQCIRDEDSEALALGNLAARMGYSEYYFSRKFSEISGMQFRDYLRWRRLAFALRDLRETGTGILDIALKYGFSSHEAFSRAFREAYGLSPSEYRLKKTPVVLRTILRTFDCYLTEGGLASMEESQRDVKTYFVRIPAHKFLHIRNYESIGYWDFWQKEALIPGCDCDTVCALLRAIPGRLDEPGVESGNDGQLMAWINEPEGRICSWGIPLAEAYGVRLPANYRGPVPEPLRLMDVPEGEYLVFEHGPFDPAMESRSVEEKIEAAMRSFDYAASGYRLDTAQGRVFYFAYDPARCWKYVRPVVKHG